METVLHFTAPGQDGDIVTAFGWIGADVDNPPTYATTDAALSLIMGNLSEAVTLYQIDYRLGSVAAEDPVVERTVSEAGLAGGEMTPINNAFLVKKTTAQGGRRQRGRNYLPGVAESITDDDGTIHTDVVNGINTNIQDMRTAFTGEGIEMALLHQSAPWNPTIVVNALCEAKIANQRTRLSR
jgi:hypothetical protein